MGFEARLGLCLLLLGLPAAADPREYSLFCQPLPQSVQQWRDEKWDKVAEQRQAVYLIEPGSVRLRLHRFGYRDLEWQGQLGETPRIPGEVGTALRMEPILVQLTLATSPPGAQVELSGELMGQTPGPLSVPLETWPNEHTPLPVTLRKPGYRDHEFILPPKTQKELEQAGWAVRWPEAGTFSLAPRWPVVMTFYEHPRITATVVALALGWLFVGVLPARRKERTERERLEKLESLVVSREDDPWVGKQLGGYFLLERLGRGGMATVYLGVPQGTSDRSQALAIKVIDRDALDRSQELRGRFMREVKILERLRHPNIVGLEACGEHDGLLFVAMEWVKGPSLESVLRPEGLTLAEAMVYLRPLLQGVAYAHAQGVVHRDLKPENVLLAGGREVKVVDFGLARGQEFQTVTLTGAVFGTPAYIPPEQVKGQQGIEPRSDQYSLGVMTFEMLTGQKPFQAEDPLTLVMMHLQESAPRVTSLKPALGEQVADVVARMMAKDPEDRYPDLEACLADLERAL